MSLTGIYMRLHSSHTAVHLSDRRGGGGGVDVSPSDVSSRKDMFDVPAEVLVELGLQFAQLLLSLPHVFLQLQTGLPGVVVTSGQGSTVAHLVAWSVATQSTEY